MARTFVVTLNDRYDLRPLKKYGDLVFLYTDMRSAPNPSNPQGMLTHNIERLEKFAFDPEKDYIVLVGTLLNATMFLTAALLEYRCVKALIYDPRTNKYFEREISEPEPKEV